MKKFLNRPEDAVEEMLQGLVVLSPGAVRLRGHNVMRSSRPLGETNLLRRRMFANFIGGAGGNVVNSDSILASWNGSTSSVNQTNASVYNAAAFVSPLLSSSKTPRFLLLGGQAFTNAPPGTLGNTVYYNNASARSQTESRRRWHSAAQCAIHPSRDSGSGFFEKAQEFVFGELELLEIEAQGAFIQIVSGVRFLE